MPTPITRERLAELRGMPHDPHSSYAVVNRTDFEGLLAAAKERDRLAERVAELTDYADSLTEIGMHLCGAQWDSDDEVAIDHRKTALVEMHKLINRDTITKGDR